MLNRDFDFHQDDARLPFQFMPEMIDRLVDGELPEYERRMVLLHLDEVHNGWRDCAFAFLEAAMFRETFSPKVDETPQRQVKKEAWSGPSFHPTRKSPVTGSVGSFYFNRPNVLAMLSGFGLAFLLFGAVFFVINESPDGNFFSSPSLPHITDNVETGSSNTPMNRYEPFHAVSTMRAADPNAELQYVTLHSCDPDFQGLSFPCYSAKTVNPEQYLSTAPAIQGDDVQRLRDAGHQVDVHRQNVVIPVSDGRKAVIPVDQVNIKYRPQAKYQ